MIFLQAKSALGRFIHRELGAIGGAVTISCLMVLLSFTYLMLISPDFLHKLHTCRNYDLHTRFVSCIPSWL
jgi:hypothetical protein